MKKFLITLFVMLFTMSNVFAESINVAFTIDNNYPYYTLLVINSILKNNKSDSEYNFYVIENNITDKNKKMMRRYVEKRGQNIEFININTDIIDDGDYLFGFSNRITPIGMARIMIPDLLPKTVDKVLYLDSDILVLGDLKNLYDTDIQNYHAAMAKNIVDKKHLSSYNLKGNYFNSGVILMNLNKWREDSITKQMLLYIKNNKSKFIYKNKMDGVTLLYPDQDMINIILNGKIKEVPQIWNNQTIYKVILKEDYTGGILHYIGKEKPWHFGENYYFTPVNLYYKYWQTSGLQCYMYKCWLAVKFKKTKKRYLDLLNERYERVIVIINRS